VTNQPNISRVVREVFHKTAAANKLTGVFRFDKFDLINKDSVDRFLDGSKTRVFHDMASELTKHSDVSTEHLNKSEHGIDEFVFRAETYVFTKKELLDLLAYVEQATFDALHPMAKWGQGD
jgi:hypothetical protein